MRIQLLYFPGCPNVDAARSTLCRALESLDLQVVIDEVDISSGGGAPSLAAWGSPTILVDGLDVAGQLSGDGAACRLYATAAGLAGVPEEASVRIALALAARGGPANQGQEQ